MIPVIAVQVAPERAPPALEQRMLEACSAGVPGARCVGARTLEGVEPHAIAVVSWVGTSEVNIEVGLGRVQPPVWRSRELSFEAADPELERWRAIGFTIALLVGDDAPRPVEAPQPVDAPPPPAVAAAPSIGLEARALAGAGLVSAAWRFGGELRVSLLTAGPLFATGSLQYALASDDPELDVRWIDASAGVGLWSAGLLEDVEGRVRAELLLENVAVSARREDALDRQSAWIPGLLLGADLGYRVAPHWVLSARVDAFALDGSTAVTIDGARIAASAGAGVFLGAGAGYRF